MIKKHVDDATNVPAWLMSRVIGKAILDKPSRKYLVCGFPRDISQVDTFFKLAREADSVVYFKVPDTMLKQRALARASFGDNDAQLDKRIANYNSSSQPVIRYYKQKGKLREINGSQSKEKVFEAFKAIKFN